MDSAILRDLQTVLPEWTTRLLLFAPGETRVVDPCAPESSRKALNRRASRLALNSQNPQATTTLVGPAPLRPSTPSSATDVPSRKLQEKPSKLDAKPGITKAKFSSITGPEILYDGESQKALFDCWTTLNSKRGVLRREMMAIRRKKVLMLPMGGDYGYSDSEDDDDESSDKVEETPEEKEKREAEERRKAAEEKRRAEREAKVCTLFEYIDGCLDKAAKGCENAAFLWLKGEKDPGHMLWVNARMAEAVARIKAELEPPPQKMEVTVDEGFDDEMESEDELPHKIPDRLRNFRRAGERM